MRYCFLSITTMLSMMLTAWSCGDSDMAAKNDSSMPNSVVEEKNAGNAAFSCKVNGQLITSTEDAGIYNPMFHKITVVAESDKYVTGIVIPMDAQAGQACNNCSGYVQEKIVHEEGVQERKIFELVQKISVHITTRRGNHFEGTFSFTVKLKEDSDQQMVVTDGHFMTDIQ